MSDDAAGIVTAVEAAYADAYSSASPERLSALFAPDATVQTEWGPVLRNRSEIMHGLVALFAAAASPDALTNTPVFSHHISPGVIVSHGTATRVPVGGSPERFLYTRVYAHRDDGWVIAANHIARASTHAAPDGIADERAARTGQA